MIPERDPPPPQEEEWPQADASKPREDEHDVEKSGEPAPPVAMQPHLASPRRAKLLEAMYYWIHSR